MPLLGFKLQLILVLCFTHTLQFKHSTWTVQLKQKRVVPKSQYDNYNCCYMPLKSLRINYSFIDFIVAAVFSFAGVLS